MWKADAGHDSWLRHVPSFCSLKRTRRALAPISPRWQHRLFPGNSFWRGRGVPAHFQDPVPHLKGFQLGGSEGWNHKRWGFAGGIGALGMSF